jgi:hypothetical protein
MKIRLHHAAARRKVFACRFPGCDYEAHRPHDRGRHESMTHGMRKGVMPPAEPSTNGAWSRLSMADWKVLADALEKL